MKNYLIVLLASSFVFSACKKEETVPKPTKGFPIDKDLEAYFSFNEGSYWVYRDSLSQAVDSVILSQVSKSNSYKETNDTVFKFERIAYQLEHSFYPQNSIFILYSNRNFVDYETGMGISSIQPFAVPFWNTIFNNGLGDKSIMPREKYVSVNGFSFLKGIVMPWVYGLNRYNPSPHFNQSVT